MILPTEPPLVAGATPSRPAGTITSVIRRHLGPLANAWFTEPLMNPNLVARHGGSAKQDHRAGPAGVLVVQNRGGWDEEAPVDAGEDAVQGSPAMSLQAQPVFGEPAMRETVLGAVHVTSQVKPDSNLSYRALLLSVNDTGSFTWFFMMEIIKK